MRALSGHGLVAAYPGREPVLRGADIRLPGGGRLALLGANGSGKTTLLRCLSGAHRPTSGTVTLDGVPLNHDRAGLREHRRHVQFVGQDPDDQLFSADVAQDVSFGPLNLGLDADAVRARVAETLDLLGIRHLTQRATHQLSWGERRKVALAGAVAMGPAVLLLDEPTAGLDPAGVADLIGTLDVLTAAGTTLALTTHDVDFALTWADEVAVMCDGVIVAGRACDVLDDADLLRRSRLRPPWTLELARRLGMAARPRTLDEIVDLLSPSQRTTE